MGFTAWLNKGIVKLRHVYENYNLMSFNELKAKFDILQKHFFKCLQFRSFILAHNNNSVQQPPLSILETHLSIKARNLCLSVCVCVPQISLQIRIRLTWKFPHGAAWLKGLQRRICLNYNDTVNKWFHKCFMNSASIANCSHYSHQSQSLQSSLPWRTLRNKRIYTCSGASFSSTLC